jgi:hypothetical protein
LNTINDNIKTRSHQNDIKIHELIAVFKKNILSIIGVSIIISASAITYSLTLPNVYTSAALLMPTEKKSDVSGMLGAYSAVAGLAGISMPAGGGGQSTEAITRITSYEFFSKFFYPKIKLENLVAVKRWNSESNTFTYDSRYFKNQKWVAKPSKQSAFKEYLKMIKVSQNLETQFVTVAVKHHSPIISQGWVDLIVKAINESMRNAKKIKVINSLNFLNEQSSKTNYEEVRIALASLQEEQMKSLMLIESNNDYIFEIIDGSIVPEKKSGPLRFFIGLFSTILGFIVSSAFFVMKHFFRSSNHF